MSTGTTTTESTIAYRHDPYNTTYAKWYYSTCACLSAFADASAALYPQVDFEPHMHQEVSSIAYHNKNNYDQQHYDETVSPYYYNDENEEFAPFYHCSEEGAGHQYTVDAESQFQGELSVLQYSTPPEYHYSATECQQQNEDMSFPATPTTNCDSSLVNREFPAPAYPPPAYSQGKKLSQDLTGLAHYHQHHSIASSTMTPEVATPKEGNSDLGGSSLLPHPQELIAQGGSTAAAMNITAADLPKGTIHTNLAGRVNFCSYPTIAFENLEPKVPKSNLVRMFFGQLPYNATAMQLGWIVYTFGECANLYHFERITKTDRKKKQEVPSGCYHAWMTPEDASKVLRKIHMKVLVDDSGVWYCGTSDVLATETQRKEEEEKQSYELFEYCNELKQMKQEKIQREKQQQKQKKGDVSSTGSCGSSNSGQEDQEPTSSSLPSIPTGRPTSAIVVQFAKSTFDPETSTKV